MVPGSPIFPVTRTEGMELQLTLGAMFLLQGRLPEPEILIQGLEHLHSRQTRQVIRMALYQNWTTMEISSGQPLLVLMALMKLATALLQMLRETFIHSDNIRVPAISIQAHVFLT